MKKCIFTFAAVCLSAFSWSQSLEPDDQGSSITFKIKNFGMRVEGSFTGLKGKIVFNPTDLSAAVFDVSVNASTINTGIGMRDNHLRKEEYFDVKNFNTIQFISAKIEGSSQPGKYSVTGKLTMKRTTKEVVIAFTAEKENGGFVFKGELPLNRRDYSIGGGSLSLADNVTIILLVKAFEKQS